MLATDQFHTRLNLQFCYSVLVKNITRATNVSIICYYTAIKFNKPFHYPQSTFALDKIIDGYNLNISNEEIKLIAFCKKLPIIIVFLLNYNYDL